MANLFLLELGISGHTAWQQGRRKHVFRPLSSGAAGTVSAGGAFFAQPLPLPIEQFSDQSKANRFLFLLAQGRREKRKEGGEKTLAKSTKQE